ncbi:hypothetical protein [Streptomyces dangxiongensis]|uniref:hypothetical protein n=1 Tax=Streptomyces dangxiongensis TaxID=1442032 RepID=UPI001F08C0B6|nr:hypothetical protein [Streptomyces dangxiongensis]
MLRIIAQDPDARLLTIATAWEITERTVQAILTVLEQAGYLRRRRDGRRNRTSSTSTSRSGTLRKPASTFAHSWNSPSMRCLSRRSRLLHR